MYTTLRWINLESVVMLASIERSHLPLLSVVDLIKLCSHQVRPSRCPLFLEQGTLSVVADRYRVSLH